MPQTVGERVRGWGGGGGGGGEAGLEERKKKRRRKKARTNINDRAVKAEMCFQKRQ